MQQARNELTVMLCGETVVNSTSSPFVIVHFDRRLQTASGTSPHLSTSSWSRTAISVCGTSVLFFAGYESIGHK